MEMPETAAVPTVKQYQYQVVEKQIDEVGLMVGVSDVYDCKADAMYVKWLMEKQGGYPRGRLRLDIHVTEKGG